MWLISETPYELIYHFSQEVFLTFGLCALLLASSSASFTPARMSQTLIFFGFVGFALSFCVTPCYQPLVLSSTATNMCKSIIWFFFLAILIADYTLGWSNKGTLTLLGFALLAILLVLSANDWFFLFLSIELLTLCSYCIIAVAGTLRELEAVIKYFAAGAISTCLLLFGIFILYVSCDSTSFSVFPIDKTAALAVVTFCSAAFLIKVGSAPFHFWVVDVYETSRTPVMVFLGVVVKLCVFFTLVRILYVPLFDAAALWSPILQLCAVASIVIGALGALFQKRIKRLLAFSSINNIGYALAGLSIGNLGGLQSSIVYMLFYSGAFLLVVFLLADVRKDHSIVYVTDLRKLNNSNGFTALRAMLLVLCMFSLAGIPPLSGFWTKFFVLSELFNAGHYALATVGAFGSILSSFYYVNLIKSIYFENINTQNPTSPSEAAGTPTNYWDTKPFWDNSAYWENVTAHVKAQPLLLAIYSLLAFSVVAYPLLPGLVYEFSGYFAAAFLSSFT